MTFPQFAPTNATCPIFRMMCGSRRRKRRRQSSSGRARLQRLDETNDVRSQTGGCLLFLHKRRPELCHQGMQIGPGWEDSTRGNRNRKFLFVQQGHSNKESNFHETKTRSIDFINVRLHQFKPALPRCQMLAVATRSSLTSRCRKILPRLLPLTPEKVKSSLSRPARSRQRWVAWAIAITSPGTE